LTTLGCQVTQVGCVTDGCFAHEPEPIEAHLRTVAPQVADNQCEVGFVLDPDADRLALIDDTGRFIGEELTLALAAEFRLRHQPGPVVVNMSTSRLSQDLADRYGCPFYRAPVGEVNVVQKMMEVKAVIGGEGNGGVIDPRIGWVRDPFIGMALILSLLAETGLPLSQLISTFPAYHIIKDKYTVDRSKLPEIYARILARWPEAQVNQDDGLRLDWPDRWVHVRPSNTEPLVRVIAEAPGSEDSLHLCRAVGELLQ
jgi:phosphomannomutase